MNTTAPAVVEKPRHRPWTNDLRTARVIRFAVGVTTAAAISFGFNWPLHFITPVITAVLLAEPHPAPTIRDVFEMILYAFAAFALGLFFTLFLLRYPMVYTLALGLVMFNFYYLANRGGPFFLVVMILVSVLLLPIAGTVHKVLPMIVAIYFAGSTMLAVVIYTLAHGLFPDPPGETHTKDHGGFRPGYSREAAVAAFKSTVTVLPLIVLFIAMGWTSYILTVIYACIFTMSPQLRAGAATGLKYIKATLLGGAAAMAFYWLIVAVPMYPFFILLMFFTALLFGAGLFSQHPAAKYLESAFIALLLLLAGSMGEGVIFEERFILRVIFLCTGTIYVVFVLSVLDRFFPGEVKHENA